MNDTLIQRRPKRKRQPTAECMRQQLALAADEIIRLRALIPPSDESLTVLQIAGDVARRARLSISRKDAQQIEQAGQAGFHPAMDWRPPPPAPPPGRICHHGMFGQLWFKSEDEFDSWKLKPWWRRMLGRWFV